MENDGKQLLIVGIDDSEHSFYALEWTLDHFSTCFAACNPPFKLMVVHAKPIPSSVISLAGPGAADVYSYVELDINKSADKVLNKAKELCDRKSVKDVTLELVEGDARTVMCETVDKYHATILVLGSHGYGAIKRAVLGSVSDYCAHHAHCSVMIVKIPKAKHN